MRKKQSFNNEMIHFSFDSNFCDACTFIHGLGRGCTENKTFNQLQHLYSPCVESVRNSFRSHWLCTPYYTGSGKPITKKVVLSCSYITVLSVTAVDPTFHAAVLVAAIQSLISCAVRTNRNLA